DKANGMLAFILTRPVRVSSYIGGKIFSHYLFIACSVTFGYIASYLYTYILFTEVPLTDLIVAFQLHFIYRGSFNRFNCSISFLPSVGFIYCFIYNNDEYYF